MIRNLKALGLALVAVFALSAVVASAASAQQGFLTSDGAVTLKGVETETEGGTNALTAFGLTVKCPGSTYTGHEFNVTPHKPVPSGATKITITPHYKICNVTPGNFPATVDMNGCDYDATLGATTEATPTKDTYGVTYDITCPVGQEITLTIFTTAAKHTENKPFCKVHVAGQNNLNGGHATDTTNGHIDLTGTVEGIKLTKTNAGEDPLLCPAQSTEAGKFDIDATVSGVNGAGGSTPISISHN